MARRPKSRPPPAPAGLAEPLEAFLAHLALERGLSRLTVSAYESDLTEFARHCARAGRSAWTEAVLADLESWVRSMHRRGHAPASLARRLSAARAFAAHLVRAGLRRDDFTELARGPRFRRRLPGRLTAEQAARIMTAPDERTPQGLRDRAMLELMYGSGLRISELCGLELQSVDEGEAVVRVRGKGSKDRVVPVGEAALRALARYLRDARPALARPRTGSALFLSARGVAISRKTFWLGVRTAARCAGVEAPVKPHLLRHAFATHLLAGGADLRSIQEMLGHADISTTQIYASVERSALTESHRRHHPRGKGSGS
ncbi:MAG: tyrosine recombinase XerD [Verrucomicrobia bacterium]|nr:tyrosine recombinase XerD [Verrucomicrobiota bacterium]